MSYHEHFISDGNLKPILVYELTIRMGNKISLLILASSNLATCKYGYTTLRYGIGWVFAWHVGGW